MIYIVRERIVFEYTWRVEADSKAEARREIEKRGDGEAESHEEVSRRVIGVESEHPLK